MRQIEFFDDSMNEAFFVSWNGNADELKNVVEKLKADVEKWEWYIKGTDKDFFRGFSIPIDEENFAVDLAIDETNHKGEFNGAFISKADGSFAHSDGDHLKKLNPDGFVSRLDIFCSGKDGGDELKFRIEGFEANVDNGDLFTYCIIMPADVALEALEKMAATLRMDEEQSPKL